jgi:uncharacterized membrane protein
MQPQKEIQFFKSIEEAENDTAKFAASLTPQERLAYAMKLIRRVYAEQIKNYKPSKEISFTKTDDKSIF